MEWKEFHLKNRTTTSTTRQSIETIERMNNENIRLHDEVKDLRHSLVFLMKNFIDKFIEIFSFRKRFKMRIIR